MSFVIKTSILQLRNKDPIKVMLLSIQKLILEIEMFWKFRNVDVNLNELLISKSCFNFSFKSINPTKFISFFMVSPRKKINSYFYNRSKQFYKQVRVPFNASFPLVAKRKLAARTFIQSLYLKALAASLRVGFCDEWKSGLTEDFQISLRWRTKILKHKRCIEEPLIIRLQTLE